MAFAQNVPLSSCVFYSYDEGFSDSPEYFRAYQLIQSHASSQKGLGHPPQIKESIVPVGNLVKFSAMVSLLPPMMNYLPALSGFSCLTLNQW
jgi:hypothetical protein